MKSESDCPFCEVPGDRIVEENEFAFAIRDGFPVTQLHTLVIPKRHVRDYFEMTPEELLDCDKLLRSQRLIITQQDENVDGFNIGINVGEAAGQTVFHCHIHLIPRRRGDVENPRGGVRNTIPGKGDY